MSSILSELIQNQLKSAFPEADSFYNNKAFADALALAIQQYLASNVIVLPGQATAGGPTAQATVSPGILNAP